MNLVQTTKGGKTQKYLLRGDSEGIISMWEVPDFNVEEIKAMQGTNATPKSKKTIDKLNFFQI
jgi:WD repeat-containing protein 7